MLKTHSIRRIIRRMKTLANISFDERGSASAEVKGADFNVKMSCNFKDTYVIEIEVTDTVGFEHKFDNFDEALDTFRLEEEEQTWVKHLI
jgi:hypothetical protein